MKLSDFSYDLPIERIAKHPPDVRGSSRLLTYKKGDVSHHGFEDIIDLLPQDAHLVFNNTKVIPARIILHKEQGARIEIFLLEPISPSSAHEEVMITQGKCVWKCMIGNARKWKLGTELKNETLGFSAKRVGERKVAFEWSGMTFSELLTEIGKIPLPPYIHREVEENDKDRYQTVYSKFDGAVAAPTAGLHFTDKILSILDQRGVQRDEVTLHVSAGTFQPIKSASIYDHPMHNEQILIEKSLIEALLTHRNTIAVGTTSMRTLESLYWYGVRLSQGDKDFYILKDDPYTLQPIDLHQALSFVLEHMNENKMEQLRGQTEIFIYPGYTFKMCKGLITNFHLPNSTLILLVAAFIGEDWRKVYEEALNKEYDFLSYGDSSLLIP